jgi:hypothetical protein
MNAQRWTSQLPRLLGPLVALLFALGIPQAMAGDEYARGSATARGSVVTSTTATHSHGGTVSSDKLGQGQFYKSEPSSWSRTASATYYQRSDGTVAAQDKATGLPVGVVVYRDAGEANVWKGEVEGDLGKASLATIGADYLAKGTVGKRDGNYYAEGSLRGRAYLLKAEIESTKLGVGDENLGLHLQAKGNAIVGVEGTLTGTASAGKNGVTLEAKAEVFAGAKATGQLPLTLSLCKMSATGRLKGEVSAGAGAKATGTVKIDWASGTATVSGELAATLGLGAGAGAEVVIDLSALVSDPGAVADCLLDGVTELAEAAVELGGDLVDAAGNALSSAGSAIADAADTVGSALANGASRAADAVGGAISSAGDAIADFFGFGGDPAPPIPSQGYGNNTPLRSNTRTSVVVIALPPPPAGRPGKGLALRANRQAYPH